MSATEPIRILQVVWSLNRGGIETWLAQVLNRVDRRRLEMDFLVHTDQACAYDAQVRARGAKILPCLHPRHPLRYARNFVRLLRVNGPYQIVHAHTHFFSGFVLRLARLAGVPVRIAHSHNDKWPVEGKSSARQRLYRAAMRHWIKGHATAGLACSRDAAADLFGRCWAESPRWRVLPYGIELTPFRNGGRGPSLREALGIPGHAMVVGHVGRFVPQKNHTFLAEILAKAMAQDETLWAVLVGDGPLRATVRQRVRDLGIDGRVVFAGERTDVADLMRHVMDVFVFPSLHEGLGIVVLESQAAGLPCVVSETVPREAEVVPALVERIHLDRGPNRWAEAVLAALRRPRPVDQRTALRAIEESSFHIEASVRRLEEFYTNCIRPVSDSRADSDRDLVSTAMAEA